jgi:type VI secretion system ImpH/TssG family protein
MAATDGPAPDHLSFLRQAAEQARRYGFFPLVRAAEARARHLPRVGRSRLPAQNVLDMAHAPSMEFPGATLEAIEFRGTGRATVRGCFVGLTGPMGPLPLHLTEFARYERRYARKQPFGRFLDLLTDRFLQFFYRAWADSQPACHADRPGDDRFLGYIAAVSGANLGAERATAFPAEARAYYAGLFASRRSAAVLQDGLSDLLRTPVQIEEFAGGWRDVELDDRTLLGRPDRACRLGVDAMLGGRVNLVEDSFRVAVTVDDITAYEAFLPEGLAHRLAAEATQALKPDHLDWDLSLRIHETKAPPATLGGGARLGWTSWVAPAGRDVIRADARLKPRAAGSPQKRNAVA